MSVEDVRSLYRQLRGAYSKRNADYALNRGYYRGEHWGTEELPKPEGIRYTLTINYVRPTVDKSVQFLLGQMPGIQVMPRGVSPADRKQAERSEALLYYAWERNDAPIVFRRLALNALLLRLGWVYTWWDAGVGMARFRSIAPDNVYPVYDGEEIVQVVVVSRRLTSELRAKYPDLAANILPDVEGDDVIDNNGSRFTRMMSGVAGALGFGRGYEENLDSKVSELAQTTVIDWFDRDGNWARVMGEAIHQVNLGYGLGRVPLVPFQLTPGGDESELPSEVDAIAELNLYLDTLASQHADIIRRYANPTVIDEGSGQDPQDIRNAIQAEGGVIPVRLKANVRYLNWEGTPPDITEQYNRVLAAIYDLSGKPPSVYGQLVTNQSGVATNMALSPATASTEERQSMFGHGLIQLNEVLLRMYEKMGGSLSVKGVRAKRPGSPLMIPYAEDFSGAEIDGWYVNRIKWPSVLRTDDPVFVQNEVAKKDANLQSTYSTMENIGIEDTEMELDRLRVELEDPVLHPEVMEASVNAATALMGAAVPDPMAALDPATAATMDPGMVNANAKAAGSPHTKQLTDGAGGY